LFFFVFEKCSKNNRSFGLRMLGALTSDSRIVKLRLPICEIYQLFRSLVYFILPFTDVRTTKLFGPKENKINKQAKKLKKFADG